MEIRHDETARRFVARVDQGEAYLEYAPSGAGVLDLRHTYVAPAGRGDGVGEALVEHAVRYAREHGHRIVPSCPFVRSWIADHPQHHELLARSDTDA